MHWIFTDIIFNLRFWHLVGMLGGYFTVLVLILTPIMIKIEEKRTRK